MFRKMRRSKQQLSQEECEQVLVEAPRGVLSVIGDDGYPYGMPLNHWFDRQTGYLYFHCAGAGHKIDAIRSCNKVSYCAHDEGCREEDGWALNFKCVIVFGRMRVVDDPETTERICREICLKFPGGQEYADMEWSRAGHRVTCLELVPDHMSGKLINES